MASIIDSFRETFEDNLSFFKLVIFAVPVYFCYTMFLTANGNFSAIWTLGIITAFFMLGYVAEISNNVLNEKDNVLPKLNFLKILLSSVKTIIAIGPMTAISAGLGNYALSFLTNIPIQWVVILFQIIIWLIVASIALTSFLLYIKKESIIDAYNLKLLVEKSGDVLLGIIFFVLQVLIINIPTTAFLGYTISVLFGVGPTLYAFCAYAIIFNIGAAGHYFAQMGYEIIGYDKRHDIF